MSASEELLNALTWQAEACRRMDSPFGAGLLGLAAQGALGPIDDLFAGWREGGPSAHIREATTLRFMGALHHLVLTGAAPALAAEYPVARPETDWNALAAAARAALETHRPAVAAFMTSPPQTNEVGRSFCLAPGFLQVVERFGLPLRIFELGSSAGLNMRWDRFGYDFAGQTWGDPASPVRLVCGWRGEVPVLPAATVIERAGCDQSPIDVADDAQALRLEAYVWADQAERLARLRGAVTVARAVPAALERADAADWVARKLSTQSGAATVLFHSVMWQYMPDATRAAVGETIASVAAGASESAPFAWLRMEPAPDDPMVMELRLSIWPEGEDRRLGRVHPHGAWVNWG